MKLTTPVAASIIAVVVIIIAIIAWSTLGGSRETGLAPKFKAPPTGMTKPAGSSPGSTPAGSGGSVPKP